MSNNNKTTGGGLGIIGVLTIVFIVLKLTGLISWSWIWVLAPLWIGFIVSICILIIALIVFLICYK